MPPPGFDRSRNKPIRADQSRRGDLDIGCPHSSSHRNFTIPAVTSDGRAALDSEELRQKRMSKFDENIFSRIAIFNNYVTKAQLEECIRIERGNSRDRRLGDILLEKGYISSEQLRAVLRIRRKKIRKYLRNPKEARESDKAFGREALTAGLINLDGLEEALLEQEYLARLNLHFQIGEVLVSKNRMSSDSVLKVLAQQGKRILLCPVCDCHYNVVEFQETKFYRCTKCESELAEPNYLDAVAVDALL